MQGSFRIGTIAGISVNIHPTWFLIFVLITSSLVTEFSVRFPEESYIFHVIIGLAASLLLFGSVLFHEMSHSLLAQKMGHTVSGITLFVFGGVSEIRDEAHTPSAEFWIAVIGPFSSFFLAGFFFVIFRMLHATFVEVGAMFSRLAFINLYLGVFNLLPAFPLDGGRVLRSILWRVSGSLQAATRRAGNVGRAFGYGMIALGVLIAFGGGGFLNGLWISFIGWFLSNAAEASVQQVEIRRVLEGVTAGQIMTRDCLTIPEDLTIAQLVEEKVLLGGSKCFLVAANGALTGLISLHEIKEVPRQLWPQTRVGEAMKKMEALVTVSPEIELDKILVLMDDARVNQVPVLEKGRLVGVITREHLVNVLRVRMDLQPG